MWISRALTATVSVLLLAGGAIDRDPIPDNPLAEVPAGPFIVGSDEGDENQRPRHIVEGKSFLMNRTEITNAQYRRFVAATGHRSAFYDGHPILGLDDRPVVGVSHDDAAAYCAHYGLRLPSEKEFERAARGTTGARFPWGDAPVDPSRANFGAAACCAGDDADGYAMTAPADSYVAGASREGILNLVGNAWEWTDSFFAPYGDDTPTEPSRKYRVLRGGAWNSDPGHLTTTYRLAYDPAFRYAANGGFRCVRSPD